MSLWEKELNKTIYKKLDKDIEIDTLIIGGGIAGLTTLYYLKNVSSVCLVERNYVGAGVSKNTTGKITYLQESIYSDLEKNVNKNTADAYLSSQLEAISLIKKIIDDENIECNLDKVTSFVYATNKKDVEKLKKEKEFLKENGINVSEKKDKNELYSISVDDTYVFHPIKYLNALKKMLKEKIYENTAIGKIEFKDDKYYCYSDTFKIIAKTVIVTCHYPFFLFPFFLPLKSHIEKSYLIAYKVDKNKHISGITVSNPGFSFRYHEDNGNIYKICLASSHNTAIKQNDEENFLNVQRRFNIPDKDIIAKWSNVDIISYDHLPFIGEVKPNLYLATGFNTWGMTNGSLAGKILSDYVLNNNNSYKELFKLKRMNLCKVKNFFVDSLSNAYAFLNSKIKKSWYSSINFEKKNGLPLAIYTDDKGIQHKIINKCPHMGCGLIFNETEKTWDCPCHSSRFNIDGKWIKGPSKKDITYKEK